MKSFKFKKIFSALAARFLTPNVIQASPPQYIGAALDPQSIGQLLAQVLANGASAAGGGLFATSSATTATLTNFGKNLLQQFTAGSATTVTIDSAYNIVNALPGPPSVGQVFGFQIMTNTGTTIATPTLTDSTVTLAGTTSVVAAALRWYQGVVTQVYSTIGQQWTPGTTFSSLAQVGSTNLFTVTLGTNSISPTVGNLIYLAVSAGTLPSGWYPIAKVSSATSFVIATPPGTVWTATAATVGTSTVAPPTYSPLVTITGLMATVTATMTV